MGSVVSFNEIHRICDFAAAPHEAYVVKVHEKLVILLSALSSMVDLDDPVNGGRPSYATDADHGHGILEQRLRKSLQQLAQHLTTRSERVSDSNKQSDASNRQSRGQKDATRRHALLTATSANR